MHNQIVKLTGGLGAMFHDAECRARSIVRGIEGSFFTTAALIASFSCLAGVPHVRRVLFEFPVPSWVAGTEGSEIGAAVGLYVCQLLLIALYAGLLYSVVLPALAAGLQRAIGGAPDWAAVFARPPLPSTRTFLTVSAVVYTGALVVVLMGAAEDGASLWRLICTDGFGTIWGVMVLSLHLGAWVLATLRMRQVADALWPRGAGIAGWPETGRFWTGAVALLGVWVVATVPLELCWRLVPSAQAVLSWRLYAIWSVHHLLFGTFLVGLLLDRVATHLVCRAAIAVITIVATLAGVPWNSRVEMVPGPADPWDTWLDRAEARLDAAPDGPVIAVAAAGGGTRAAAFATLVLEGVRRESSEGHPETDRIWILSGVSGGSLAAAHHVFGRPDQDIVTWNNAFHGDLAQRSAPDGVPIPRWTLHNRHVDDMFTNFTAPMLRGMILPFVSRGSSLSDFWHRSFGWSVPDRAALLLLNATDVRTGSRVVVGFPPVPPDLLTEGATDAGGVDRRAMVSLLDLAGGSTGPWQTVSLEDAVRMSSAFPWALDAPRLPVGAAASGPRYPLGDGATLILDGGVFDNTGLDALASLFATLDAASRSQMPERTRIRTLLDRSADRGLIVLEIDSGAKEAEPGTVDRLLGSATDGWDGMANAALAREEYQRRLNLDRIEQALSVDVGGCPLPMVHHLRVPYHPRLCGGKPLEVMTAWAVGPTDIANVIRLYECGQERFGAGRTTTFSAALRGAIDGLTDQRRRVDVDDPLVAERARVAGCRGGATPAAGIGWIPLDDPAVVVATPAGWTLTQRQELREAPAAPKAEPAPSAVPRVTVLQAGTPLSFVEFETTDEGTVWAQVQPAPPTPAAAAPALAE
ncbi:MAG: patatin-like phospholipase family protein [Myxococcota bacterium]